MSHVDPQILSQFIAESKSLVIEALGILEEVEADPRKLSRLLDYANRVDRIMGAAKSLATMVSEDHALHILGNYTGVCKAVGTRGAQIVVQKPQFFDVTISFLLDATDLIGDLMERIHEPASKLREEISDTFVDRLRWLSDLYREDSLVTTESRSRSSVASSVVVGSKSTDLIKEADLDQTEIDDLLKKLGV